MQAGQILRFNPFRLDPVNVRLWRGKQVITLTPKAFAVLCYLVEHAGQLVTKDALLTAVWPEIYVSEGVLSECVREVRKALGDTPQAPRFIETVHRRGYRFIGKVVSRQYSVVSRRRAASDSQLATGNWQLPTPLVGREAELRQLHTWLAKTLKGARQLVFVTGEAGIGKTSVVEAFLARLTSRHEHEHDHEIWIGRGQCIEHYGQGEAYLPLLEALGRLCREPDGKRLIDLLSQHAPTWLVQMLALLTTTDLEVLQRRTQGATRERMLRELAEAVEVLTTERPLVLWLEDLQWSDVSTLDWLAFVARRREPARLLIIGAYRPVEVIVGNHSLKAVKQELQLHGQCVELPLAFLTEEHVATYLAVRFKVPSPLVGEGQDGGASRWKHDRRPPHPGPLPRGERGVAPQAALQRLAQLIHQRTEGNPLFMVNLVDYLVTQEVLVQIDEQWRLQGGVTAVASWAPESLQQLIEQQIERLSPQDRHVLEVASVAGAEFSAAAVAAGAGIAVEAVEEQCGELARQEQLLRAGGTADWPDGTVAARYGFLHALYQDVLYGRLTARRRLRLHQQIGERVEQAYGERAKEIAAELAVHFERGRDYKRAIQYLQQAGENAVRRSAHQEAVNLFTKGLELLKTLPNTPARTQQELRLQLALAGPLTVTKGYTAPEVERAHTRALELCRQLEETPKLFQVLAGLGAFYHLRAEHKTACELAEQCLSLAQNVNNPIVLVGAHHLLGCALYPLGEFALAREHWEAGIALYDSQQRRSALGDSGVLCLSYAAWVLWFLGYPDQALQRIHAALTLAQERFHPYSLAIALNYASELHHLRREVQAVQERAEALVALSTEQGFPLLLALGTIRQGWALTAQGQVEEGIPQIRQGMAAYHALGTELGRPYFLAYLAEAYGKGGQAEEGLSVLAEALAAVDRTGECMYEAELYRLKGELTLRSKVESEKWKEGNQKANGKNQKAKIPNTQHPIPYTQVAAEAEACFLKAIEIARKQQAKSLELRAVMSLSLLWQSQGKRKEAHKLLSEIYGRFTEGFDTKDLQEAKALLEELNH
jgi:DNA-binding winged helix-turn-helix (wHTH) protein/predicted ATPase